MVVIFSVKAAQSCYTGCIYVAVTITYPCVAFRQFVRAPLCSCNRMYAVDWATVVKPVQFCWQESSEGV